MWNQIQKHGSITTLVAVLGLSLAACGDDGGDNGGTPRADASTNQTPDAGNPADGGSTANAPAYSFESAPGTSSVAYNGQIFRQVLIAELSAYINGLTTRIDSQDETPAAGETAAALNFYYRFDSSTSLEEPLTITTDPPILQANYSAVSSSGADLRGKIAGLDPEGQHKDWSTEFAGWSEGDAQSPDALIQYWFTRLDTLAAERAAGSVPTDPDGAPISLVYVTPEGQDLKQLIEKFLLVALVFSQGVDDYLDDDLEGKGLNATNVRAEGATYSELEHGWDEGFGYFGAARNYDEFTDEERASAGGRDGWSGYHDRNGDTMIDLKSEFNFKYAANAAVRDLGSAPAAATNFSDAIFDAFVAGRTIIHEANGAELTAEQKAALVEQRDTIVENWEKIIASTVIHYINELLQNLDTFGTPDYNFLDQAKYWSEAKGYALGFQFNRTSPVTEEQFAQLHTLLGDAPVLPNAQPAAITAYRANLLEARALIAAAFAFDDANVGDETGQNGW